MMTINDSLPLLAIETTDLKGSVVLVQKDGSVIEKMLTPSQRSAQSLVPSIQALFQENNVSFADLKGIAVAMGPGSFTGLRVGLTTAKVLAWTGKLRLFGIETLYSIACGVASNRVKFLDEMRRKDSQTQNIQGENLAFILSVALNAQRGDAAARHFLIAPQSEIPIPLEEQFQLIPMKEWLSPDKERETIRELLKQSSEMTALLPQNALPPEEMIEKIPFFYCGAALEQARSKISDEILPLLTPESFWNPSAKNVACAAVGRKDDGDDPLALLPIYSRKSAAEEKLKKNH